MMGRKSGVETAERVARNHPWLTWGTAGSIVTVLTALALATLWVFSHFQSTADADRKFAWMFYSIGDVKLVILRNRVNECDARKADRFKPLNSAEAANCEQYTREYNEQLQRNLKLYEQAMQGGNKH